MLACAGLLKPRGSIVELLKSEFNAKNFIPRLSWSMSPAILLQFTLKMCASAKNSLKAPFGGFKVIDVNKSKKPVASACYDIISM